MTRILIGALSAWKYHDRRQRCLSTWMADGDATRSTACNGLRSVFLLACPTAVAPEVIGPHALVLPCPDDYASLPQRTRWFCRWALGEGARGWGLEARNSNPQSLIPNPSSSPQPPVPSPCFPWDYLFKCDDDTYVSIPRLLAFDPADRDYIGAEWKPGVAYGSGGAGYFLSRKAAAIVAEKLTQSTGPEDLLVGQVLRAAGVEFSIEPRLVPFGSMERRPRRDNDLITTHACLEAFLAAHAETGLETRP